MAENLHFADSLIYVFGDAQKVCPENFHLPSMDEFQELVDHVGGFAVAAKALKSTSGWPKGEFGIGTAPTTLDLTLFQSTAVMVVPTKISGHPPTIIIIIAQG